MIRTIRSFKEIISACAPECNYATVNDGDLALKIAESLDFDLVLMDMTLPGKNGYEIAGTLRKIKNMKMFQ